MNQPVNSELLAFENFHESIKDAEVRNIKGLGIRVRIGGLYVDEYENMFIVESKSWVRNFFRIRAEQSGIFVIHRNEFKNLFFVGII